MLDVIEASQRVEKGGDFLTHLLGPDWPFQVDLDTLHMSSGCKCVAGQLHDGSFWDAMREWFNIDVLSANYSSDMTPAVEHGFTLDEGDGEWDDGTSWDVLKSAWVGLITVRRSRQAVQA